MWFAILMTAAQLHAAQPDACTVLTKADVATFLEQSAERPAGGDPNAWGAGKINVAFFEAFGSHGVAALERVRADVPADLFVTSSSKLAGVRNTPMVGDLRAPPVSTDRTTTSPVLIPTRQSSVWAPWAVRSRPYSRSSCCIWNAA